MSFIWSWNIQIPTSRSSPNLHRQTPKDLFRLRNEQYFPSAFHSFNLPVSPRIIVYSLILCQLLPLYLFHQHFYINIAQRLRCWLSFRIYFNHKYYNFWANCVLYWPYVHCKSIFVNCGTCFADYIDCNVTTHKVWWLEGCEKMNLCIPKIMLKMYTLWPV